MGELGITVCPAILANLKRSQSKNQLSWATTYSPYCHQHDPKSCWLNPCCLAQLVCLPSKGLLYSLMLLFFAKETEPCDQSKLYICHLKHVFLSKKLKEKVNSIENQTDFVAFYFIICCTTQHTLYMFDIVIYSSMFKHIHM